jgi:hypothetical protein
VTVERRRGGESRDFVVAEITRQLQPVESAVANMDKRLERLYNSNGGPPGYLQTARAEDNGRFEMIFKILNEVNPKLRTLEDFVRDHETAEKQKEEDQAAERIALAAKVTESEKRFKRWLGLATLFLGILTVIMNLRGCGPNLKALFLSQNHSILQDSQTHADYHPDEVTK